jgi:hypothetical protein
MPPTYSGFFDYPNNNRIYVNPSSLLFEEGLLHEWTHRQQLEKMGRDMFEATQRKGWEESKRTGKPIWETSPLEVEATKVQRGPKAAMWGALTGAWAVMP